MNPVELIRKKRDGQVLEPAALASFVQMYAKGSIPDYQAAALLMAIYFRGLDGAELSALTEAMLTSGDLVDLTAMAGPKIDKHSTGGVGDKVSLHLAPAVAACGVKVPMISGRGLGHTGGTLDKLESIPGFCVDLGVDEFRRVLDRCGLALIGQTERLVPADKKLYALRDVTGTVESIPLIAASIMSKKLAEGIDGLVLDVKVGSGAFMKTLERGRELGRTLVEIGQRAGKRVAALITDMDQPLGRYVGNAAEVVESLAVLENRGAPDLVELTLALGSEMLLLGGLVPTVAAGRARVASALADGSALDRFRQCVALQGGRLTADFGAEALAGPVEAVVAGSGFVQAIDAEAVGLAALALGAGRVRKEDAIDPLAWVRLDKKVGEPVQPGEPVATFTRRSLSRAQLDEVEARLQAAFTFGESPPPARPLIIEAIRERSEERTS